MYIVVNSILIFFLAILNVQGGDYFDCRREGQDCAHSQVCLLEGANLGLCGCGVGSSFARDDCSLISSLLGSTRCEELTDYCSADDDNRCVFEDGVLACNCPEDLYGYTCNHNRYNVLCDETYMHIFMNPFGSFGGEIFVYGHKDTPGCKFNTEHVPSYLGGLSLVVAHSDCGGVTVQSTNKSRVVIVQYNSLYLTGLDSKVTVTCGDASVDVNVEKAIVSLEEDYREQGIDDITKSFSSDVTFDIKLRDGSSVTSAVPLDETLTFEFSKVPEQSCSYSRHVNQDQDGTSWKYTYSDTSQEECLSYCTALELCGGVVYQPQAPIKCYIYLTSSLTSPVPSSSRHYFVKTCESLTTGAILLMSCTADNTATGADVETLPIVKDGCASTQVGKLMQQHPSRSSNTLVTFTLQPFKFNKNTNIHITCGLRVCPEGALEACPAVTCPRTNEHSGLRRRRQADVSLQTVNMVFEIYESDLEQTVLDPCPDEVDLKMPILAAVSVVVFLLIVTCVLILVYIKKYKKKKSPENKAQLGKQTEKKERDIFY